MKRKILQIILVGLFLHACNKSRIALQPEILKLGPDTYLAIVGSENQAYAKTAAVTKANQHCSSLGKEILVSNITSDVSYRQNYANPAISHATHAVNITFQCLAKDDPSLVRPTYQKPPSVVIEDRRN